MSDVQHGPLFIKPLVLSFPPFYLYDGDIAQLARASALQAEGQGFKSPNLHGSLTAIKQREGRAAFFY